MRSYSDLILTNKIVNLTDSTISMYEQSTGRICKFYPVDMKNIVFKSVCSTEKQYIVDCRLQMTEVIACGGDIDNIAFLNKQARGRGGEIISYLVWAKDPKVEIEFLQKNF